MKPRSRAVRFRDYLLSQSLGTPSREKEGHAKYRNSRGIFAN